MTYNEKFAAVVNRRIANLGFCTMADIAERVNMPLERVSELLNSKVDWTFGAVGRFMYHYSWDWHGLEEEVMREGLQTEQSRWQEAIRGTVQRHAPAAEIDGGGCDSGDPLDLSLTEIGLAHNHWQNRANDALYDLGLIQAIGEGETSLDAMIRLFVSDDWEPDVQAMRAERCAIREQLREIMDGLRHNAAHPPQNPDRVACQFGYFAEKLWAILERTTSQQTP